MKKMLKQKKGNGLESLAQPTLLPEEELPQEGPREEVSEDQQILLRLQEQRDKQNQQWDFMRSDDWAERTVKSRMSGSEPVGLDQLYEEWKNATSQLTLQVGMVENLLEEAVPLVAPRGNFPEEDVSDALRILSLFHQQNKQIMQDVTHFQKTINDHMSRMASSAQKLHAEAEEALQLVNDKLVEAREALLAEPLDNAVWADAIMEMLVIKENFALVKSEIEASRWTRLAALYSLISKSARSGGLPRLDEGFSSKIGRLAYQAVSDGHVREIDQAAAELIVQRKKAESLSEWLTENCQTAGIGTGEE